MRKKALIITYYWPPAGGPGVQRWLKFTTYLPEFKIEPIVYIPENPNYPLLDESLLNEIPQDITIITHPIKEPYKLANLFSKKSTNTISKGIIKEGKKQGLLEKLMLYIRGNYFIPDARKSWVKPSVNFLNNYISEHNIDTIITTGPPHSLHLIGLKLKSQLGVKWLADFRDPWTTIGYHKQLRLSKSSKRKHKALEREVLNTADQVIVTSTNTKIEFESLTSKPITVITNGYDKESVGKIDLDKAFSFSHIGSLLSRRNPKVLWQVLQDIIEENYEFSDAFQLNLVGAVSEDVLQSIDSNNLTNYLYKGCYISHDQAINKQRKSQILLLIEIDSEETKSIIPGKLFEYMASNRPIIAIGPKQSDVERILKETNTGHYFNYDDYDGIKKVILDYFEAFKEGNLKTSGIGLQKYSRRALTENLAKLI